MATNGGLMINLAMGTYAAPQALPTTPDHGAVFILGQWWYDFSRIPQANLSLSLCTESGIGAAGGGGGDFGDYIIAIGDVNPTQLFDGAYGGAPPITEDADSASSTIFQIGGGFSGPVVIPNPGVKRQILLAVNVSLPGSRAGSAEIFARSINFKITGQ